MNQEENMMPDDEHHHHDHGHHHHGPPQGRPQQQPQQPQQQSSNKKDSFEIPQSDTDKFLRDNLHLIIFAVIIIYLVWNKFRTWSNERKSTNQVKASQISSEDELANKLQAARERQFLASLEATKKDQEIKERHRHEDLAEKERKLRDRMNTTNNNDDNYDVAAPLPHLPAPHNYRPSDSWNNNSGGGHYRPTGFSRPSRGGG